MTFQKKAPRYTTNDWFNRSYSNWNNSEKTRLEGRNTLEECKYVRSETDNKTKWDQQDSNSRLNDQIERVRVIKQFIEDSLKSLDDELDKMGFSKDITEKLQTHFYQITQVNTENLVMREGRREIDLVVDEVEDELHKERLILDSVRLKLQTKITEMFEQTGLTQEAKHTILSYLQRKNLSLEIDIDQYNLTENSPSLTLKPDSTRVPEKMFNVEQWEDVYCLMRELSESTFNQSTRLRETIHHVIHTISNDINSQNLIVMFAMRKRIHEFQNALSEDRFQKELLEGEAKRLENEVRCLDVAIKHKVVALKLAQTRLENRLYGIQEDLLRDAAQYGLADEVSQLEVTILTLKDKKCQAQHALDSMERQILRLSDDIDYKMLALRIEQHCLANRKRVNPECSSLGKGLEETIAKCVRPDYV